MDIKVYFSDFFEVSSDVIEAYGAFNVSLVTDLPLFIDPFLLFNSKKQEYRDLHNKIIQYLTFLRDRATTIHLNNGLIQAWYAFPEVRQNWLGFTKSGNNGSGLGKHFAKALHSNLHNIFKDFGSEKITQGSHFEKLCLIKDRVGKDNISDFTTNLIKDFLLQYTEQFANQHISSKFLKKTVITKVHFNYETETWENGIYTLPFHQTDYVLLTPQDILTKDDTWINKLDLIHNFRLIPNSIPDEQLRAQINNYFFSLLSKTPTKKEMDAAAFRTIQQFPKIIDYFIKYKEENGDDATSISSEKVAFSRQLYLEKFKDLCEQLARETDFYNTGKDTYEESMQRVLFLKDVVENKDGYRVFYMKGKPIEREQDVQIMYRLTWYATLFDVNKEVNNGRGAVDFKVSKGNKDKSLVEFKLASNPQLKRNLENQIEIYQKANNTDKSIKVILYFSKDELDKVNKILTELKILGSRDIVLIDARNDNKPSASVATNQD